VALDYSESVVLVQRFCYDICGKDGQSVKILIDDEMYFIHS